MSKFFYFAYFVDGLVQCIYRNLCQNLCIHLQHIYIHTYVYLYIYTYVWQLPLIHWYFYCTVFLFYVQELNIANILVILYFSCRIIAGSGWSTNQPSRTTRPVAMSVGTRCRQLDPPKMVVASCDGGNLFKIAETLNNNVFAACEHVFFFLQSDFVLFWEQNSII
jgi:hypothetical protein